MARDKHQISAIGGEESEELNLEQTLYPVENLKRSPLMLKMPQKPGNKVWKGGVGWNRGKATPLKAAREGQCQELNAVWYVKSTIGFMGLEFVFCSFFMNYLFL